MKSAMVALGARCCMRDANAAENGDAVVPSQQTEELREANDRA